MLNCELRLETFTFYVHVFNALRLQAILVGIAASHFSVRRNHKTAINFPFYLLPLTQN